MIVTQFCRWSTCASLLLAGVASNGRAQVLPISWSARAGSAPVHENQPFVVQVRALIPYSWHLYSLAQPPGGPMATSIAPKGTVFAAGGKVTARNPDRAVDRLTGLNTETYADSVTFKVPVIPRKSGAQTLELLISYQACTDSYCTAPRADTVRVRVKVAATNSQQR